MALVPTYMSKLSVGAAPAVFGHAVDMAFLAWLAARAKDLSRPRVFVLGVLFVAACDLAYVSAVIHVGVFLAVLGVFAMLEARGRNRLVSFFLPLGLAAGGALLALALYYRDFLGAIWTLVSGLGGQHASSYQPTPFLPLLLGRTVDFFGWGYPLVAAVGLALLLRSRRGGLLLPWFATYLTLLFLRAKAPNIFRWVHDTLFVTPAFCLGVGVVIGGLWGRGGWRRFLALSLLLAFALQGLILQWLALSRDMGSAD
jgi:hypothetical protein